VSYVTRSTSSAILVCFK